MVQFTNGKIRGKASQLHRVRVALARWVRALRLVAFRHNYLRSLSEEDYAKLHAALLQACDDAASRSGPEVRRFLSAVVSLAEPWETLRSVTDCESQMLLVLLSQAEDALEQVDPWQKTAKRVIWGLAILILTIVVSGIISYAWTHKLAQPLIWRLQSSSSEWHFWFRELSFGKKVGGLSVILVIFGYLLLRVTRKD